MEALTIPSTLPMLADFFPKTPTLVTSSILYLPSLLHLTQIPTALELRNPFSESITVTGVDLELYPCQDQVTGTRPDPPVYVEPEAEVLLLMPYRARHVGVPQVLRRLARTVRTSRIHAHFHPREHCWLLLVLPGLAL